jgi:predicted nucleotidyltransferase
VTEPRGPSLERVASVAAELGDLARRVVFVGGAIAPLLQTDPPFPRARLTTDVDGIIASTTYADQERLRVKLNDRGFRQGMDAEHVHRWVSPSGIPFDLVPAGSHLGGSGNPWDAIALETAIALDLGNGVAIKHVSASAFLAQKWAAHHDRGRGDPLASSDLEDILALLASRPGIVEELAAAPSVLREYVNQQAREFLHGRDAEDLLAAHLNTAQDPASTIEVVRTLLNRLAHL